MDWTAIGREFGLLGITVIAVAAALFCLLKWVLEQFKTELTENRKERKEYLETLGDIRKDICEHNIRAKEFQNNVQLEHKEMITTLSRINGWKDDKH